MQTDDTSLVINTPRLNKEDENMLRERFISDFCRKKGWDKENLSPTQMLEIVQQSSYRSPGMILS